MSDILDTKKEGETFVTLPTEIVVEKVEKKRSTLFQPGQSGNPAGRPKKSTEFKVALEANTVPALNTILGIMNNPKAPYRDRLKAAEIVLDRRFGKATQPIGGDSDQPLVIQLASAIDDWAK